VVSWADVANHGKLVLAGLWTESSVSMTALSALSAGYEVYVVTNASGGRSKESHRMAIERMIGAGAVPITAAAYLWELQRDWSRSATVAQVLGICEEHGAGHGEGLAFPLEKLASKEDVQST
jgi:hypothetical protein